MRLGISVLAVTMLVLAAPAAQALQVQGGTTVTLRGLQDGAVVGGTLPLTIEASSSTGIRRLTMVIDGATVIDQTPGGVKQNVSSDFSWDTTHYVNSTQLSRNRKYEVKVRAVSNGGGEQQSTVTAVVNNAPSAPTGFMTDSSGGTVTIRWTKNPEPDITGYRVERFYGNDYSEVTTVNDAVFTERRPVGRYDYRVVAIRQSEVAPSGVESAPSETVTVAVESFGDPSAGGAGAAGARGGAAGKRRAGRFGSGSAVGATGLPSGASLPQRPGLSGLPEPPAPEWGTYEKRLPYKLPKGGVPIKASAAAAGAGPLKIIPPDGLRWVAAGFWLLALAGLARLLAMRLTPHAKPAKIEA